MRDDGKSISRDKQRPFLGCGKRYAIGNSAFSIHTHRKAGRVFNLTGFFEEKRVPD
jgi:hypothetical protein